MSSGGTSSARPALDARPLDGVVAVGGPYPVGAVEDAEVDAAAAAGARLDLEARVAGAQLVEQPVEGEGLLVHGGPVAAVAACDGFHAGRGCGPT